MSPNDAVAWVFPIAVAGVLARRTQPLSRAVTIFFVHATACALLVALLKFVTQSGIGPISRAMPVTLQDPLYGSIACSAFVSIGYLFVMWNGRR